MDSFDEIDHHILVGLLRRKIHDERFINLVWKALRAGYLWMEVRKDTLLGTPQGSGISPILANIYLHELDKFAEGLRQKYEKGKRRRHDPSYCRLQAQRNKLLRENNGQWTAAARHLTKRMRAMPSGDTRDPDYVRVKFIRYADDWIVGVIGPRWLAEQIKDEICLFLREELWLQLSTEKTLITHAKTERANFLGTKLGIGYARTGEAKVGMVKGKKGRLFRKRITGYFPSLEAPVNKLIGRLHAKGFCDQEGFPTSKPGWSVLDADQLVRLFNTNLWGLINYYRPMNNFGAMSRIQYILRFSLAKTLAQKYRTTMRKMFRKHGRNLRFQWEGANGKIREASFKENTDWSQDLDAFQASPPDVDLLAWQTSLRTRSKLGYPCLICGSDEKVEMHHVRHIRKMGKRKPTGFTAVMRAMNRKQVPVCKSCHGKIHRGTYDGIGLQDLAYDFTARPV